MLRPERRDQLQEFRCIVERLEQSPLHRCAERRNGNGGDEHAFPESRRAAERIQGRVRDVRAEHVQRAVREIDDPRDAEDERQTGRDDEQRGGSGEPRDELCEDRAAGE